MKFVEEVVVDEFLPTYRSMLAAELRDRGLTQREVAEVLGISQSAVSKYAHGEVATNETVATDDRVGQLVERVARGLATGEMSRVQALVETEVRIRQLEEDLLAQLHEREMPDLSAYDGAVRIHDPDSELRVREQVRSQVRKGIRSIENTSGVASLIPNVGSNLVVCLPEARDIDDVAGIPGRIFDVKGRATVPDDPEFGVSEHVATVLLSARENGSKARVAFNIRYDEAVIDALTDTGATVRTFDAERDIGDAIADAMTDTPDVDVLYHTGAYGIEPIVYILGTDVTDVIGLVRKLL